MGFASESEYDPSAEIADVDIVPGHYVVWIHGLTVHYRSTSL